MYILIQGFQNNSVKAVVEWDFRPNNKGIHLVKR